MERNGSKRSNSVGAMSRNLSIAIVLGAVIISLPIYGRNRGRYAAAEHPIAYVFPLTDGRVLFAATVLDGPVSGITTQWYVMDAESNQASSVEDLLGGSLYALPHKLP